jgi:hypothetical protein
MTIESAVTDLTTQTTALLTAVNVAKATLDASVAAAQAVLTNTVFVKVSNGVITPRIVTLVDSLSITLNADTTDIGIQSNTQATGVLTVNAPTGTLVSGQKIILRVASTNIQTFSWNAIFMGSDDLPLPTATSGSGKYDYYGFLYSATASRWMLIAKIGGF